MAERGILQAKNVQMLIIDEADATAIADAANVKAAARRASVSTTRGAGTIEFVDVHSGWYPPGASDGSRPCGARGPNLCSLALR